MVELYEVNLMKKYINIGVKIIICILLASNLASCRSAHELNKLGIVIGVGIDKGIKTEPVELTLQLVNVSGGKTPSKGSDGGSSKSSYLNLKEKGKSISEAAKAFSRKLNRKLFFSHNQVIILGKNTAEEGIKKYMDFFLRYRETRLLTWVLVSKGPAGEIFNINPALETTPGRNIGELIKNERDVSQIPTVDLKDFASKLMSKTTAPVAPIIEVSKDDDKKIAYLSETAVFKKDKMVGALGKRETRGLLWVTNRVKDGVVVLGTEDDNKVNIITTRSKSKITPEIKDNEPSIKIEIEQEGDLQEQTSSEDLVNPKAFAKLEKVEGEVIKEEVMAALQKSRELNADIFGFGDIIYQHYPKQWTKMEKDWEQIFKNMRVDVSVDAKLRRTGRITKPIMSKEE